MRSDQALSLSLSYAVSSPASGNLAQALLDVTAPTTSSPSVVLDLRDLEVLTARTVIAFAYTAAEHDVRCVLLHRPSGADAQAALDVADPRATVPRAVNLWSRP